MLELDKLRKNTLEFFLAKEALMDGPIKIPLLKSHYGALALSVLEEEDRLGIKTLKGGEKDGSVTGNNVFKSIEGCIKAKDVDA